MSTIVLFEGLTMETLPESTVRVVINQDMLLSKLGELKRQWYEATGGDMDKVELNLRLLFLDIENVIRGIK